jgi:hypothetical protein
MVKSASGMINSYERSDIIHIMKMNRFTLTDSDTAHLIFSGCFMEKDYTVEILAAENEPQVIVKQNKSVIVNETLKSIDDLKIFLEERLYQHFGKSIN